MGLSVPDLEAAEEFYIGALGFVKIRPSVTEDRDVTPDSTAFSMFPPAVKKFKMAWLSTGNGVGFELFQFITPSIEPGRESRFASGQDCARGGLFHFSVTTHDLEGTMEKALKCGAKRVAGIGSAYGEDGVYLEDPWGNGFELITCNYDQLLANRDDGAALTAA
jgi:catechol 2,3-dioxygenase-like lactoylglutathione lyase family enzyme